jgi:Domain of unknown function (DUF1844)
LSSGQDTSVSSLWTPSGEHRPEPDEPDGPTEPTAAAGPPADPEVAEELERLREQLAATPVADILANHAVGLWQLAIVHLVPDAQTPPRLDEARLAIDAMAALVEGLGDRLGEHEAPLRDALSQLRLAYVQVTEGDAPEAPGE